MKPFVQGLADMRSASLISGWRHPLPLPAFRAFEGDSQTALASIFRTMSWLKWRRQEVSAEAVGENIRPISPL